MEISTKKTTLKVFPSPLFWSIIIIGVFLDIVSKHFATAYLLQQVNIFGDIVYFLYTENTGIAFSLPLSGVLLQLITVILTGVIAYYYFQERKKLSSPGSYGPPPSNKGDIVVLDMSFGLILAGAIGNGIERIFQGYVIDFIGVQYFAVFNLADAFISVGAALYLYLLFTQGKVFKTKL